jgi:hypothetical protein
MPAVELTLEQLVDAVRQLPAPAREALLDAVAELPTAAQTRATAQRVRRAYRLSRTQRARLAELLHKGNLAELTAPESRELDELVDQFEVNTLRMARDLARQGNAPGRSKASP